MTIPLFLTLLLFGVSLTYQQLDIPTTGKCSANAHWSQCSNTATGCYDNCQNYKLFQNKSIMRPCFLICGSGCDCNEGYVYRYGSSGDCILPSECPTEVPKCGANAHWESCANSQNNCSTSCNNYFIVTPTTYANCNSNICKPGCDCDRTYIFKNGTSGDCMRPSTCPNGPGEDIRTFVNQTDGD